MNLVKVGAGMVKVELRERIPLESGRGFTTRHKGYELATCEVLVDIQALVNLLGKRAAGSRSNKSNLQGGALTVRCIKRTPV